MSEYIDKEKLLEALKHNSLSLPSSNREICAKTGYDYAVSIIKQQSTISGEEIKSKVGFWIGIEEKTYWSDIVLIYQCSCCGKSKYGRTQTGITFKFPYCPNCGAKMDLEQNG